MQLTGARVAYDRLTEDSGEFEAGSGGTWHADPLLRGARRDRGRAR